MGIRLEVWIEGKVWAALELFRTFVHPSGDRDPSQTVTYITDKIFLQTYHRICNSIE
jgi:hypothetical protein